jgi:LPXTG-site transpeptidase (sortase) family protein
VVVTDTLPAGVTLNSTSGCAEDPGGVPTCSLGVIAAGGSDSYTISVTVDADVADGTTLTNTATVSSDTTDPNAANDTDTEDTTVNAEADLAITKSDSPDPVLAGNTLTYTVDVSNAGPSDAQNVVVTDTLPAGVTFVSTSGCAEDPNGVPTCSLGDIAASGSASYTIMVNVDPSTSGAITNTVSVSSSTTDPDPGNNTYVETTNVVAILPPSINKSFQQNPITADGVSTLQFTITNPNTGTDLAGVTFTDNLPGVPDTMIIATPSNASTNCIGGVLTANAGTGLIQLNNATVGAGTSCTVDIDITAPTAGSYINSTSAVSSTNGGTGNSASDTLQVSAATITDPAVTKSGDPATAQVGDTVTFTIVVSNNGPDPADNVVLTDVVPSFLTINNVTVDNPVPPSDITRSGNTITINFGTVTPTIGACPPAFGSSCYIVTVTTVVNASAAPQSGVNNVSVATSTPESNPNNNDSSAPITIVEPVLTAPETGFAPGRVSPIPAQSAETAFAQYENVTIRIPTLGINTEIVGVTRAEDGWDVTWLWNQVGYLDGTAFPGWDGNSVLTSHVYLPNGLPGPFVNLKQLRWGDRVIIESFGTRYIYEVRESRLYTPEDSRIIRHEERPWLTLITCQGYDEGADTYTWRRVVRAVLIHTQVVP